MARAYFHLMYSIRTPVLTRTSEPTCRDPIPSLPADSRRGKDTLGIRQRVLLAQLDDPCARYRSTCVLSDSSTAVKLVAAPYMLLPSNVSKRLILIHAMEY